MKRALPVLGPLAAAAAFGAFGHWVRALVAAGLAALCLALLLAGAPVDRWIARIVELLVGVVSVILTSAVGVLLVLLGVATRLVGGNAVRGRSRGGWVRRPEAPPTDAPKPFSTDDAERPRRRRSPLTALGAIVALLALDLGVGLAGERLAGVEEPVVAADRVTFSRDAPIVHDRRADTLAMADSPWSSEYFDEIQRVLTTYWPFTETRPVDFHGRFVNIDGWERRSIRPSAPRTPVVWMFGGSTTWGEGQRDEHTIASELVELSVGDGIPVTVRNFGQRGWTHFQEMILFTELLDHEPRPDLVLFYDGANELNAQSLGYDGVPTHVLANQYAQVLSGAVSDAVETRYDANAAVTAWRAYARHSAIAKGLRWVRSRFEDEAAASGLVRTGAGGGTDYVVTDEDARNAIAVYERGRAMTSAVADSHGVPVTFFWQPVRRGHPEAVAISLLTPPTVDISDALDDHPDVYIDGGHTNEAGAAIVAGRIWEHLRDAAEQWYDDHPEVARRPADHDRTPTTTAAPVSTAEMVTRLTGLLDAAEADPCTLDRVAGTLLTLRAGPADAPAVAGLVRRYVLAIAATAPADLAPEATLMRSTAALLVPPAVVDPDQPVAAQFPPATDPDYQRAFIDVSDALIARCDAERGER